MLEEKTASGPGRAFGQLTLSLARHSVYTLVEKAARPVPVFTYNDRALGYPCRHCQPHYPATHKHDHGDCLCLSTSPFVIFAQSSIIESNLDGGFDKYLICDKPFGCSYKHSRWYSSTGWHPGGVALRLGNDLCRPPDINARDLTCQRSAPLASGLIVIMVSQR
jgi:hypothetical protein